MPVHASSLAPTSCSRRNHEIMRTLDYRLDQSTHHFWIVAAIAVKEDDDFAISRERAHSRAKRPPISPLGFCYHARAGGGCNFRCVISAAVINHDYFVSNLTRHVIDDFTNRLLFVERGDDY